MTLYCPLCNEPDATVTVSIAEPNVFYCTDCEDEFTARDVVKLQAKVAQWTRVLAWVEQCPREEVAVK